MPLRKCAKIIKGSMALLILSALTGVFAADDIVQLGQPVSEADLRDWDLIIMPDGSGLPEGAGSAVQGSAVYEQQCASCHGASGKGMPGVPALVGENNSAGEPVVRAVGNYWPSATTLFDYVRRAMPPTAPKSLSTEQVYQVVAYVLFLNDIIGEEHELTHNNLSTVDMPNRNGFVDRSQMQ